MTTATIQDAHPKKVHTKIVGVTFEGRQEVLRECQRLGVQRLELVLEPDNQYDENAVAVEARVGAKRLKLGYVTNSDRLCFDCGNLVGGSLFQRSRTFFCEACDSVFGFDDPAVSVGSDGESVIECPKCSAPVDFSNSRVVRCPSCGGTDFGRGGLATRLSRAIASGVVYDARVMEFTGGEAGPDGRTKSIGCNILIHRRDS